MARYTYKRMTAQQFSAALNECGLTLRQFCRLTGASSRRAEYWLNGQEDIPPWVPVFLAAMTIPAAKTIALATVERFLENPHDRN